jgi:hypothetical protein
MATKKKVENFMREINEESDWTDLCNKEVGTISLQALQQNFAQVGTFA